VVERIALNFVELSLEVEASISGWQVIKPPVCQGASGVHHRFSLLAFDGERKRAFDIYPEVGEIEVLRTFVKSTDTGISACIVCSRGKPTERGLKLAGEYGMKTLSPREVGPFFEEEMVEAKASNLDILQPHR
jgi:hypothetical protein